MSIFPQKRVPWNGAMAEMTHLLTLSESAVRFFGSSAVGGPADFQKVFNARLIQSPNFPLAD
jgi:hypothetical protein